MRARRNRSCGLFLGLLCLLTAPALQAAEPAPAMPVAESVPQLQELRQAADAAGLVYADDLMAAMNGVLLEARTPVLPAGRYRLHVPLSIAPVRDPRIGGIAVVIQAGKVARTVMMPDFPRNGEFRDFMLEFNAPGGQAFEVCLPWSFSKTTQELRVRDELMAVGKPVLAGNEHALDGKKQTGDVLDLVATAKGGSEQPSSTADKRLIPEATLAKMAVRLAARPPILEKLPPRTEVIDRPFRPLYTFGAPSLMLFEEGVTAPVIVVGPEMGRSLEPDILDCARTLRNELEQLMGVSVPMGSTLPEPNRPSIEIGLTAQAKRDGIAALTNGLNHDGFVIRVAPERIYILGAEPSGTRYGVYCFLNHYLHVRKYHPDPLWHVVPVAKTIRLPAGDYRDQPDFILRNFSNGGFYDKASGKSSIGWMHYNGLQYHTDDHAQPYGFHHNMGAIYTSFLQREKRRQARADLKSAPTLDDAGKIDRPAAEADGDLDSLLGVGSGKADPKGREEGEGYDQLAGSLRHLLPAPDMPAAERKKFLDKLLTVESGWEPCFTSSNTAEIAFQAAAEAFDQDPELRGYSLGFNDGDSGYCSCTACRAALEGEDDSVPGGRHWNYTSAYWRLLNRVAERVEKEYPGKRIGGLAYRAMGQPPGKIRLQDSVYLLSTAYLADMKDATWLCGSLDCWSESALHVGLYEYAYPGGIPRFHLEKLQAVLKSRAARGGNFYYAEVYPDWQIEGPKYWIMTQLLWDNDADIGALLDEYCNDLYGKAAKPMRAYWDLCRRLYPEALNRGIPLSVYGDLIPRGQAVLPFIEEMKRCLDEAEQAADDELVKLRIQYVKGPVVHDMAILADLGRAVGQPPGPGIPADEAIREAIRAIGAVNLQRARLGQILHRAPMSVHAARDSSYLPERSARVFYAMAREAAETLRQAGKPADEAAFRQALESQWERAAAKESDAPATNALRSALQPMLDSLCAVPNVPTALAIDGKPDEAFLKAAARVQFQRGEKEPAGARDRTEVAFGRDAANLYLCAVSEAATTSVFACHSKRDGSVLYSGDALSVVLTPGGDPDRAVFITVDAHGQVMDQNAATGRVWETRARIATGFDTAARQWTVEMSIPLSDLGLQPGAPAVLGANVIRHYKPKEMYKGLLFDQYRPLGWYPPSRGKAGYGSPFESGLLILE